MTERHDHQGRLVAVTGAARGIGRAIVERFHRQGDRVLALDRDEAAEQLVQDGLAARFYRLNVTDAENVRSVFGQIVVDFGHLHMLCNNAGVSTMNRVVELSEEEWDFNFNVNAKGVFLCTQAALPSMVAGGGGVIVNTASMAGTRGVPLLAHYAASKWAVIGFTKSVAIEVAPFNIRVNAVCPGYVRTSMQERELVWEAKLRGLTPEAVREEYVHLTPQGRIEEPEDVADVVVFLASEDARFLTGEAVHVTGGAHLL
jgi:NAD(P)-dependent dehydrogenase (short-subunit alcohol dehydrogenase family)